MNPTTTSGPRLCNFSSEPETFGLHLAKLLLNFDMRKLDTLALRRQHLAYTLTLRRNTAAFVDVTLTHMKTVTHTNTEGPLTAKLLLSLIQLGHFLIPLIHPILLLLMSRQ